MNVVGKMVLLMVGGIISVSSAGSKDANAPPYRWSGNPKFQLAVNHQPLNGWRIEVVQPKQGKVILNAKGRSAYTRGITSSLNTAFKGNNETLYKLHFDYNKYLKQGGPPIGELASNPKRPIFLGWDYHDFSHRFNRNTGERGFSRNYINYGEFVCQQGSVALNVPKFKVNKNTRYANWQSFLMPVVEAEGGGDYTVINGFDRAGMTVGFMQMAAHTPDDMIALLKSLIQNPELQQDSYANPARWFPELGITPTGKLGYRVGKQIYSLEEPTKHRNKNEGFGKWAYYREDFVRFCNPSVKTIDRAEVEFASRWLMWSMSPKMRDAQLVPAIVNVVQSLKKLENPPEKVTALDASIAAVILHWKDGAHYREVTSKLLRTKSVARTFMSWEGDAGRKIVSSNSEHKILQRRVEAVRKLFERDPTLYHRLNSLKFNFKTGHLKN